MKKISSGKVRDIYDVGDDRLVIVTSDRISAFDVILPDIIPNKGVILNQISEFWLVATKGIIQNHLITTDTSRMPKEFQSQEFMGRSMLVKKLKMLPIECIVRGYITGSGWESYKETGRVCGVKLPEGLQESEELPFPIYTPTTKAAIGRHDEHISLEQTIQLVGEELAIQLRDKSIEIYSKCAAYAETKGIIIADTKLEFGLTEEGELCLADEVVTPDSSRFWPANKYEVGKSQESFDKQYVRNYLKQLGWDKKSQAPKLPEDIIVGTINKYTEAYNIIVGGLGCSEMTF